MDIADIWHRTILILLEQGRLIFHMVISQYSHNTYFLLLKIRM